MSTENGKKTDKIKLLRSVLAALSAFAVIVGCTIAWLASNNSVDASGMRIQAADAEDFQLAGRGNRQAAEKDHLKDQAGENILNNGIAYFMDSEGRLLDTSDETGSRDVYYAGFANLAWRLGDDVRLMPGASGKLTFYIIPRKENLTSAQLTFTLKAYEDEETAGIATGRAVLSGDEQLQNLVMGHILFFQDRAVDGSYKGWIAPGSQGNYQRDGYDYSFTITASFEKDKPYPVTLYWIWPNYFRNYIYTNQKGDLFTGTGSNDYQKLLAFLNQENVQNNAAEHRYSKMFYVKPGSNAASAAKPVSGSIDRNMTDAVLNEGDEAYDNADQYIGENAEYLYVNVSVKTKEQTP